MLSIHDPIHGSIEVTLPELRLIDAQPFQRLRAIKQLGFSEMAFPGATHSRYAHSLGAMQMATRMVDRLLPTLPVQLPAAAAARLRQAVRLAMLFHDIGHAPLSHVTERVMPKVEQLGLPEAWVDGPPGRQASHEDFTLLILHGSPLTQRLAQQLGDAGIEPALLASLVLGRHLPMRAAGSSTRDVFVVGGIDLLPLLHAIISGELDADRMDYLRRDAYYCGVSYGNFDHVWLCNNLTCAEKDGELMLALGHKAVWGFENFLLARYHMFLAVYHHHTTICFDYLLGRHFAEGHYTLPHDVEQYLQTDDIQLMMALRQSDGPWAQRVVRRAPWRLLRETHAYGEATPAGELEAALTDAGLRHFRVDSKSQLSRYFGAARAPSLHVVEPEAKRTMRIDEYTPLYRRFAEGAQVSRIYCHPDDHAQARTLL